MGTNNLYGVRIQGSGTGIVFVPGAGLDQTMWHALVGEFEDRYETILFDWPLAISTGDFGPAFCDRGSMHLYARNLLALMAIRTSARPIHFVGYGAGGMIGALASIEAPELFQTMTLVCASPCYCNDAGYTHSITHKSA